MLQYNFTAERGGRERETQREREREREEEEEEEEYLERLTCTDPKRLHVLYKYILSKFNAYMNAHTHAHT